MRGVFLALVAVMLAACAAGMAPYALPVSEQAFTIISNSPLAACSGRYSHSDGQIAVDATVSCVDGSHGTVEIVTRNDGHPVSGTLNLKDGRTGAVTFAPILGDRHAYGTASLLGSNPASVPQSTGFARKPASKPASVPPVSAASPPAASGAAASPTGSKAVRSTSGQLFRCSIPVPTLKQQMIDESIARYPGSCPCPYFSDRAGRSCGKRSAWSRAGGYSPLCYPNDISADMVREFCQVLEMRKAR